MTVLGFYVGGVSAAAFGAVNASKFAHILVANGVTSSSFYVQSCGAINYQGDSNFGKLDNRFLSYGWISCNTEVGGVSVGADAAGRVLPLHLAGHYIEITVDSGTTFSGFNRVATKFKASAMDSAGNKGALLYEFDGTMNIWSGRMSSDASIAGRFAPITGSARLTVAQQIYDCAARNL